MCDAALARVYAEPFYVPKDAAEPARSPALLPPAEREEDREDREPTNEDFAQPIPPSLL
jgi:hypothetical protein